MKAPLKFDPNEYDYGAPTEAIRSVLAEWAEIDWFEPNPSTAEHAASLFRQHQRLAHAQAPELFPLDITIRSVTGDRNEFQSWCQRVRSETAWDWKFSILKKLSDEHAKTRGWSPETQTRDAPVGPTRPGDIFFVIGDDKTAQKRQVIWNSIMTMPSALDALPRQGFGEAARFYISYAHNDALDCMKWQFAERSADMRSNPFLPLLLCYEAGAYPFSLARDSVVLFRFDESSGGRN